MPKTVQFNVGGKIYEVSKSLLEAFPNTMLADKANESSSSTPIFIDRDPDRFAFCLDYMRDNSTVYLPETVSKSAILKELKFFGFVDIDETKICDEKSQENCMARFNETTESVKRHIAQLQKEVKRMEENVAIRKQKIEKERLALKCREFGVKCTEDRFWVPFEEFELLGCNTIHCDKYFIGCCKKLGLCVKGNRNQRVCLTRTLTKTEES